MTLVGSDDFGRFVRARLIAEGVDVRGVGEHQSARTGITFVAVREGGERSFLFFRHPSADQMICERDVDPALIAEARCFHFGSSTLSREPARAATRRALAVARAAGVLISVDPNWRRHLWDEPGEATGLVEEVLEGADVVKLSDDELEPLTGSSDPRRAAAALHRIGCQLVVVTLGARGCYFSTDGRDGEVPAEAVEVVDTTGAGDAFVAGLLASLLKDDAPVDDLDGVRRACAAGHRAAAAVCTHLGATLPRG
jgi:fructokinase